MRQANVNLVTVGVFSWAWLQPEPTVFEFGWLDDVLGILHDAGIAVDLANASASPPPWFSHRYPDSLPVDADGHRLNYGGRQAFCPSSADYRDAAAELTQRIVDRYADHPALAMWHVHNEYGCHNPRCFCETSAAAFRTWLQQRYDDLPELNDAWGTAFWSQRYSAWEQVIPPRRTTPGTFPNPGQQLDFARFCSDETTGVLPSRSSDHPGPIRAAGNDQLHGILRAPRLLAVVRKSRPDQQRPLSDHRLGGPGDPAPGDGGRPDPLAGIGRSVAADGTLDVGGELAATQSRQTGRATAARLLDPRCQGRRWRSLLPVARRAQPAPNDSTPRCFRTPVRTLGDGRRWSRWAKNWYGCPQ